MEDKTMKGITIMDELEARLGGRLLKVSEAAKRLGIAEQTLWKWVYDRRIASVKLGRTRRIDTKDIAEFIRSNTGRFLSKSFTSSLLISPSAFSSGAALASDV